MQGRQIDIWSGQNDSLPSPHRLETGWGRKQSIRRDYDWVETDEGRRFWLFRCLATGDWYLHGIFQ